MELNQTTIYIGAAAVFVLLVVIVVFVLRRRRGVDHPMNPYVEALALLVDGEQKEAYNKLQESIRSGKAPTDAYIRLGRLLRRSGNAGKALQIHKSLTVKTDLTRKEKTELFVSMAKDYSALGKSDQAVSVLETAVKKMNLKDPQVFFILANEYHHLDKTEAAYNYLKELTKTGAIGERELSLYLSSAGEHQFEEGNEKEARKLLQRALKHDSENALALFTLGNLQEKSGDADGALDHWKKAAYVSPELSGRSLQNLERVMFQSGKFSDVERVYREVLEKRPWDEYATLALASFYKKQGRGGEAIDFLEEYRSMHPESVGAMSLLTSLYATLKDADTLEKFLEENESHYTRTGNHSCSACGFQSVMMRWHCPRCNRFDSFSETHEI